MTELHYAECVAYRGGTAVLRARNSETAGVSPTEHAPALLSLFGIAGILELVGGPVLIVGLLTRPVAFVLSGQMAFAYWIAHVPNSVYPVLNGSNAAILFCFVFLYIAFAGPGPWSLDAKRGVAKAGR